MYDMVSKDCGCFLPGSYKNNPKPSGEGPLNSLDGSQTGKQPRKKGVRRSVSFSSEGPKIQHVDSVKSILQDELPHEDLEESLSQIWYDKQELATVKMVNEQLVQDQEEELSLAGGGGASGEHTTPQLLEMEARVGDTLRGLERQTEEGSWQAFQNRAKALGAVLDTKSQDAEELASLASEATEEARSAAQKRALQDEKEALEYLSDVRDSLLGGSLHGISVHAGGGYDDASVLSGCSDESFTFSDDEDDDEDVPKRGSKFANLNDIDKIKPKRNSATKSSGCKTAPASLDLSCPIMTMNKPDNFKTQKSNASSTFLSVNDNADDESEKQAKPSQIMVVQTPAKVEKEMKSKTASLGIAKNNASVTASSEKGVSVERNKSTTGKAKKAPATNSTKMDGAATPQPVQTTKAAKRDSMGSLGSLGSMGGSSGSFSADYSNASLSIDFTLDDVWVAADSQTDAKAAIRAIKKSKKIRRVKTAPIKDGGLDLSCPMMTMNKPTETPKKTKAITTTRKISRSKTMPASSNNIIGMDDCSAQNLDGSVINVHDQDDGSRSSQKKDARRRASNEVATSEKDQDRAKIVEPSGKRTMSRCKTMPETIINTPVEVSGTDESTLKKMDESVINSSKNDRDNESHSSQTEGKMKTNRRSSSVMCTIAKFKTSENPENVPSLFAVARKYPGRSKSTTFTATLNNHSSSMLLGPDDEEAESSEPDFDWEAKDLPSKNKRAATGSIPAKNGLHIPVLSSFEQFGKEDRHSNEQVPSGSSKKQAGPLKKCKSSVSSPAKPTGAIPSRSNSDSKVFPEEAVVVAPLVDQHRDASNCQREEKKKTTKRSSNVMATIAKFRSNEGPQNVPSMFAAARKKPLRSKSDSYSTILSNNSSSLLLGPEEDSESASGTDFDWWVQEPVPAQRASTGSISLKKPLGSSEESVKEDNGLQKQRASTGSISLKKVPQAASTRNGPPPRSSSMGNTSSLGKLKVKLPTNGGRTSVVGRVPRVPRRKPDLADACECSKEESK